MSARKKSRLLFRAALTAALLAVIHPLARACEACRQQQPRLLRGITHGAGPDSSWDYLVVGIMVFITLYSFYALIRYLAKPDDRRHEQIKKIILNS